MSYAHLFFRISFERDEIHRRLDRLDPVDDITSGQPDYLTRLEVIRTYLLARRQRQSTAQIA